MKRQIKPLRFYLPCLYVENKLSPRISGGQFTYYIKIYQAYLHLIRKTGTTKKTISGFI